MDSAEELLKQAQKLNEEDKYEEVIDLLTDDLLEKVNNANLFAERSQAFWRTKQYEQCFNDSKLALLMDSHIAKAYIYRGNVHGENKDYSAAIEDYTFAIQLEPQNDRAYLNRAIAYDQSNFWEKALNDFDKAIQLNPNNKFAYIGKANGYSSRNDFENTLMTISKAIELYPKESSLFQFRGDIYNKIKQFENALADYSNALKIDPNNYEIYSNRGFVYEVLFHPDKALMDFNKSIEINEGYVNAYVNRGNFYYTINDFDNALSDYNKAIEINNTEDSAYNGRANIHRSKGNLWKALNEYSKIRTPFEHDIYYRNRGLLYLDLKDYAKAIEDFNMALTINPSNPDASYWLSHAESMLGKHVSIKENPVSVSQLFINATQKLSEQERMLIYQKGNSILEGIFNEIRKLSCDIINENVVHYTKLSTANILLETKESNLRYYNAVYMNDPEEGKLIQECLDEEIVAAFKVGQRDEEHNIYLGSFLPAAYADELILWRTYGKNEQQIEATGCSIEIDSKFFDKENSLIDSRMESHLLTEGEKSPEANHSLYRVLYYNKRERVFVDDKKGIIKKSFIQLNNELKEILALKDNRENPTEKDIAINKIIFYIISELRYFIKSSDYSYEKEFRVIQMVSSGHKRVQFDSANQENPPKLFIESQKPVFSYVRKVTLGPKVPHPEQWIYLEAKARKNGGKIILKPSEVKFQ